MKFRKRPVTIEAEQWFEGQHIPGVHYATEGCGHPLLMAHCHTDEGPLTVSNGDWVICGVKGEYYPCKPDVFEATYRQVHGVLTPTGEMEELAADLVVAWEVAYNYPPGMPAHETSIIVPRLAKVPAQVILRPWSQYLQDFHREYQGHLWRATRPAEPKHIAAPHRRNVTKE